MPSQLLFSTKSPSTSPSIPQDPSPTPFGKFRSQLENTLRSATRSKPTSQPAHDFATLSPKSDKGKQRASAADPVPKEAGRSRVLQRIESKIAFRTRRVSITPPSSPDPQSIIGKTKDGGRTNVNAAESSTRFIPPSLRTASTSSPALHLSPKSQPPSSILTSPTKDSTRRSSLQSAKDISGPIPLSPKGRSNSNSAQGSKGPFRRPPPLSSPSSPSLLSSSPNERPRTPDSPTPLPSRRAQHRKQSAGNISPPASPTRARSPTTRTRVVSPSQRGLTSASTSQLPLTSSPRPSLDSRPSNDASRRPSVDTSRRPSIDHQRRAASPSTVRPRPVSPASYTQNRHFNISTSSLAPTSTPEQRELIRSATSILCKEMRKAPPHLSESQTGLREWEDVGRRLQHLVRAERMWGRSGSSQISVSAGGVGSSGIGEDRERRLFSEALRDGFVLCQLMNKLRPSTIARPDPREDGFIRTSNVTKFLASCSSQGVSSEDLFHRDDLIESTPESLARVARTVIAVVKVVEFPVVNRSKVLTGQGKKTSDSRSGPYSYDTASRAASSVPNLLQRSASPTGPPSTPIGRKRWSPPSPNLPTVRSVTPSERGSGGSSRTNTTAAKKNTRTTPITDRSKDITPSGTSPTGSPRSLLAQTKSKTTNDSGDVFSNSIVSPLERKSKTLIGDSSVQHSVTDSAARQSMASSAATDVSAYSSLLDVRNSSHNKFGTIRTMTTEATSFAPSDMPSYTRTEGSSVAASLSDDVSRKRVVGRERRVSEVILELSKVAEERPEDISSRPGSKSGHAVDKETGKDEDGKHGVILSPERVHLGKGKWPDDFLDVFKNQSRTRPIPIKLSERQDSFPGHHSPISVSPPRKLASVGASRLNESLDSIPRRPTHRARHSIDTVALAPKESVLRCEASPDGLLSSGSRVIPRRTSVNQRNGTNLPRTSSLDSKNGGEHPVPFPRSISGENVSSSPSSDGQPGPDDRPRQHRGRFQSEVEGLSSRMRARPSSYDELGNKPRRARFESMVNLGVASSNASASDLLSRDSLDGSAVRQTLIVREEGKPPTHFQLGNCIGRGQFGSVYRALNLNTGQMVAVKRIRLEGLKEDEVTQLMREVDLVKSLSHPSIVKYEGMARDEDTLNIVLEYAENGSLGQTLKAFGKLNESLVAGYVVKILEGLHYLHQSDVVHCDLKAANILTTKNGNVKLSDFGVSLNLRAMEREIKDVAGTPNWMAPEVIELKGASTKADIWSLGCTVIELLTGRPPYAEIANSMSVMFRIVEDDMPPLPEGVSPLLEDFLKVCFHKDPTLRPSAELLCEHEWLKKSWSGLQDLRPQDSIPFLRRVSTDFQKSEALQFLSQIDSTASNSPFEDDLPRPDAMMNGTPPTPISARKVSNDRDDMSPRDHSFVKTTFSKPMVCRVCLLNVKKNAVICASCSLIAHSKCTVNAPPTCDLRAQLLLYAQYAEKGNPSSAYSNSMDLLNIGGRHIPTSPMSEVAYVAPSPSSKMSVDIPIVQSPSPHGSPNRPPTAFKFMAAFRTKTSRTPESGQVQGSSTSLLPAASDTHSQGEAHVHQRVTEKAISRMPSVLKRKQTIKQPRPHSLSSNGTSPNSSSMRSAAGSLSSRLELRKKTAVSGAGMQSQLSAGESDAPMSSRFTMTSEASTVAAENSYHDTNHIPGSMPLDNPRHMKDSRSGNCAVQ